MSVSTSYHIDGSAEVRAGNYHHNNGGWVTIVHEGNDLNIHTDDWNNLRRLAADILAAVDKVAGAVVVMADG